MGQNIRTWGGKEARIQNFTFSEAKEENLGHSPAHPLSPLPLLTPTSKEADHGGRLDREAQALANVLSCIWTLSLGFSPLGLLEGPTNLRLSPFPEPVFSLRPHLILKEKEDTAEFFLLVCVLGGPHPWCLGFAPGSAFRNHSLLAVLRRPYGMLGIESRLTMCKANVIPSLQPQEQ